MADATDEFNIGQTYKYVDEWEWEETKQWMRQSRDAFVSEFGNVSEDYKKYEKDGFASLEELIAINISSISADFAERALKGGSLLPFFTKEQRQRARDIRLLLEQVSGKDTIELQVIPIALRMDENLKRKDTESEQEKDNLNTGKVFVFRIKASDYTIKFVDCEMRVYSTWKAYLKNNKLPQCIMCYPEDGFLRKRSEIIGGYVASNVEFGEPKSCKMLNRVMDVFEHVVMVSTPVIALASFWCPASWAFALGATSYGLFGYSILTQGLQCLDQFEHGQNCRAALLNCMTSVVTLIVNNGLSLYLHKVATAKRALTAIENAIITGIMLGLKGTQVISFAWMTITIVSKPKIEPVDVIGYVVACHNLYSCVMSPVTAGKLLDKVRIQIQAENLQSIENNEAELIKENGKIAENMKKLKEAKQRGFIEASIEKDIKEGQAKVKQLERAIIISQNDYINNVEGLMKNEDAVDKFREFRENVIKHQGSYTEIDQNDRIIKIVKNMDAEKIFTMVSDTGIKIQFTNGEALAVPNTAPWKSQPEANGVSSELAKATIPFAKSIETEKIETTLWAKGKYVMGSAVFITTVAYKKSQEEGPLRDFVIVPLEKKLREMAENRRRRRSESDLNAAEEVGGELNQRNFLYKAGTLLENASTNGTIHKFFENVSTNENICNGLEMIKNYISQWVPYSNTRKPEAYIEKLSESRLTKMSKCCPLTNFSCHSESTSNGMVFHAVFLPDSKSVWKSSSEEFISQLCAKLDPLVQFAQDKLKMSARLEFLMTIVRKEPVWHTFHYAIACGFMHYLEAIIQQDNSIVLDHVTPDGRPPLSIAAEMFQLESLRLLLRAGASLTQQDVRGRTVVHWAATTSVEVLRELSSSPHFNQCLSILDGDGYSPLSSAIKASNFETVQFLMELRTPLHSPNSSPLLNVLVGLKPSESLKKILELITSPAIVEQVDENNRTVFHHALHPQILSTVLRKSFKHINLNHKDNSGSTALHLAVKRGDLDSTILFLTHGANVNETDVKGETPLMKAVAGDSVLLVKALLVFDADIERRTFSGDDVFAFLLTSENRATIEKCLNIAANKKEQSRSETNSAREPEDVFALSLDGGGIRGLVLIQMLIEIEKRLGHAVMKHFDWVAGTSTGAILALALCQGKTPAYCRDLYFRLKDDVFTGSRPYSAASLERLLKEELGEMTTMEEVARGGKRVMVTTCQANISPLRLHLVRSYDLCPTSSYGDPKTTALANPKTTLAWKAARCSSAAPTYFPSVDKTWMDGGLAANNPCCSLLQDIQEYNTACQKDSSRYRQPVRLGCVLSLGTGKSPVVRSESIDVEQPQELGDLSKMFDAINAAAHLGKLLIQQVTAADGPAVTHARSWCDSLKAKYFRFSPQLSEAIDLAETKNSVLIEMLWQTKEYMAQENHSVAQLTSTLKTCVMSNRDY